MSRIRQGILVRVIAYSLLGVVVLALVWWRSGRTARRPRPSPGPGVARPDPDYQQFPPRKLERAIPATEADAIDDNELVVGVRIGDEARAYPIRYLGIGEHVNDTLGDRPICVSWCPLTGSTLVFDREIGGQVFEFGFDPGLYKDNLVLRDTLTGSLWNQLSRRCVMGELEETELEVVPAIQTSWGHWRQMVPETTVVDLEPGGGRPYDYPPPTGRGAVQAEGEPKTYEPVLGLALDGATRAYPFSTLAEIETPFIDRLGEDLEVEIHFDEEAPSAWATDLDGEWLPGVTVYWHAWKRFHPETSIYRPEATE